MTVLKLQGAGAMYGEEAVEEEEEEDRADGEDDDEVEYADASRLRCMSCRDARPWH